MPRTPTDLFEKDLGEGRPMNTTLAGREGEAKAAEYLRKKRYEIIGANYRCRFGELDLIAKKRDLVIFVEVKLRKSDNFARAAEFVDIYKQKRLRATAELYLSMHPTKLQPRFDVIEIYAPEGYNTENPVINHMEDAFQ